MKTFSLADDNARKLVQRSSSPRSAAALVLPQQSWLRDPQTPGLKANNLRLWYARWLTHERLYDEAQNSLRASVWKTWWIRPRSSSIKPWLRTGC